MKFLANIIISLVLFLVLDAIWLKLFAGDFFAEQLSNIGRFTADGAWNIRTLPGVFVYVLMAVAVELFIFRNKSIYGLKATVINGFILGFIIYGVFDFTNRAIIEQYPLAMVIVDVSWGSLLFAALTYLSFQLRRRLTFL